MCILLANNAEPGQTPLSAASDQVLQCFPMSHKKDARNIVKVSKGAKIRNRYNQVPHLTQDTNGKVTNSQ